MKYLRTLHFLLIATAALAAIFLGGCAQGPTAASSNMETRSGGYAPPSTAAADRAAGASTMAPRDRAPKERPGLGTGWGEGRDSQTVRTTFVRADGNRPAATDRVYYNDRDGVEAMLGYEGGARHRVSGLTRLSGGIALGLRGGSGSWLDGFSANGRVFFVGNHGERYEIVVRNDTGEAREVVLSVDGLDVMDGRAASFAKRGYIVGPGESVTVDGFRTSAATVAAFRFSTVSQSYASLRHGDTRIVGVIGVAVFPERRTYSAPPYDYEAARRHEANPFPSRRWAQPPPE